ncbi:hypothetical protein MNBD_GAMMA05-2679 [hydrothermal vent metagenome]|uniref:Uncharacterized protein n=1 Tax=hydrothermal vent metagenome TaxID=652676 RepID=A0A3B0W637_9ZZZZ
MKVFFLAFTLLAVLLAAYPFLKSSDEIASLEGLPWQIEQLPDGSTQVFGLRIGVSRLSDALEILGTDMDIAIIASANEIGNLEMYYGHYRAGLLSGKLILQTDIDLQKVKRLRERAAKFEYMASGLAKKYILSTDDLPLILEQTIIGLTFIPAVNLDEEVIVARFGEPQKMIQADAVVHYLYPDKGLHIALHAKSKEVLQYVSPENFQQLVEPLQ